MAPSNDDSRPGTGNGPAGGDAPTVVALSAGQTVFGRYELQAIAGRGGMGVVWRARDRDLERIVALKFLPEMVSADPEAVKELKGETRHCLQLTHPHIVRVHDFIQSGTLAAISMEFVAGASLARLKADAPTHCLPLNRLAPLTAQLCDALDYAHRSATIVHRDLKPANLLVSEQGQLKVTDFGIARSLTETHTRLTNAIGSTSGTLLYMSPQQLMGDKPTPSDDIYALGATLYEMLAGKPPFHRGDGFSLMTQIREKAPPALAAKRAELEIDGERIPPEWEAAIIACLEKDPVNRPATAGEVAARIGLAPSSTATRGATFGSAPTGRSGDTAGSSATDGTTSRAPQTAPVTLTKSTNPGSPSIETNAAPLTPAPGRGKLLGMAAIAAVLVIGIILSFRWVSKGDTPVPVTAAAPSPATAVVSAPVSAAPDAAPASVSSQPQPSGEPTRVEALPEPIRLEPPVEAKPAPVVEAPRAPTAEEIAVAALALAEKERQRRAEQEVAERLLREERERKEVAIASSEAQAKWDREDEAVIAEVMSDYARPVSNEVADAGGSAAGGAGFFRRSWSKVKTLNPIRPGSAKESPKTEGAVTAAAPLADEAQPVAEEPTFPPVAGSAWTSPTAGIRLVWIEPGAFTMGSPLSEPGHEANEGPETRVRLTKGFWLGATPVTRRQWSQLMRADPSEFEDNGSDAPVEQVSWHLAMAYCRLLNQREAAAGRLPEGYVYTLPTEAEWEYACRAGTAAAHYASLDSIAWYDTNRGPRKGPRAVAQKQPNAWGLYDMIGNVFQWCGGWDNAYDGGERMEHAGTYGGQRRIARGGGWSSSALHCRAAFRLRLKSGSEEDNVGFRVALASRTSSP